jgi:hypothetical protein
MDGHDNVGILVLKVMCKKCSADTKIPTPPLVEEEAPLLNVYMSRREQNYWSCISRRQARMIVLVRPATI